MFFSRLSPALLLSLLPVVSAVAAPKPRLFGVQPNAAYPYASSDGRLLVVDTTDNVSGFQVWNVATRRPLWKKNNHSEWLVLSPTNRQIVVAHANHPLPDEVVTLKDVTLELRDARTGRFLRSFRGAANDSSSLLDVDFSPNGRQLRMMTTRSLRRWDVASGKLIYSRLWPAKLKMGEAGRSGYDSASFVPNREEIVVSDRSIGRIVVLSARNGKLVRRLGKSLTSPQSASVGNFLQATPGGYSFYECPDYIDTSHVFRVSDGKLLWTSNDWPMFSTRGKVAFVVGPKGVAIRDGRTGRTLRTISGPKEYGFDISSDTRWMYEGRDGKIWKWRVR